MICELYGECTLYLTVCAALLLCETLLIGLLLFAKQERDKK